MREKKKKEKFGRRRREARRPFLVLGAFSFWFLVLGAFSLSLFELVSWLSFVVKGPRGFVYLYFIGDDAIFARVSNLVELKFGFTKEDDEQCFYRKYSIVFLFCSSFLTLFHSDLSKLKT